MEDMAKDALWALPRLFFMFFPTFSSIRQAVFNLATLLWGGIKDSGGRVSMSGHRMLGSAQSAGEGLGERM